MVEGYTFTRGLDYPSIVAGSEKVAWTVDQVLRDRHFDPTRPIVPRPGSAPRRSPS